MNVSEIIGGPPKIAPKQTTATTLPLDAIVLETDAPDISPAWFHPARNSPEQLPASGAELAELRDLSPQEVVAATRKNALAALPRLAAILSARSLDYSFCWPSI
jgi:Tat protein secretion system quality control protein TatD with DNase activity